MAPAVYLLCAATACACGYFLLAAYRRSGAGLLLWSGLSFIGLTTNNLLVFVDLVVVPNADLSTLRNLAGLAAMAVLVYGLIWEAE